MGERKKKEGSELKIKRNDKQRNEGEKAGKGRMMDGRKQ